MRTYTDDQLRDYATGLGISIEEARQQWIEMEIECEAYAKQHGITYDEAEIALARKEMEECGMIFAIADLIEKHANLFDPATVSNATAIKKQRN